MIDDKTKKKIEAIKEEKENAATYTIKNTLLRTGFLWPILKQTYDMYLSGEDISNSPYVEWGRRYLKDGRWWYGVQALPKEQWEKGIKERQETVIALYHSIQENGYNGSIISIYFDEKGQVQTYDGFHRLNTMKYLGMEVDCNTKISYHDPKPELRGDFPLAEILTEINSGEKLYQPHTDPRLENFHLWNKDSPARLAFLKNHLVGKTVLDIGCSEGYFPRELTKLGYQVTALENDSRKLAVTRYLNIINNLEGEYVEDSWQNYLKRDVHFDNILMLSVFHHQIIARGPEKAFGLLQFFIDRADKVFFETPVTSKLISWLPPDKKDLFDYTEDEFKQKLESSMRMKVTKTWYGKRPLFVMESVK